MSNENLLPVIREMPAQNEAKAVRVNLPPGSIGHNVLTKMKPYTGITSRGLLEFIVLDWLHRSPEWLEALALNDVETAKKLWREQWTSHDSTGI